MKSKIKVRQHRNAARPSPQAKTPRNHKPENVSIVIFGETCDEEAKFEVPKSFYRAMVRDALAKGISLKQWIENAVRVNVLNQKDKFAAPAVGGAQ
jgi:hypothetical protein